MGKILVTGVSGDALKAIQDMEKAAFMYIHLEDSSMDHSKLKCELAPIAADLGKPPRNKSQQRKAVDWKRLKKIAQTSRRRNRR